MKLIDGKALAEKIKDSVVKEITKDCKNEQDVLVCDRPNMAIVLVGDREDSQLYVSKKEAEAKEVGIDTHLYKFAQDVTEEEVLATVKFLSADETIDAILVQLPLPSQIDTDKVIQAIAPEKDVDRFHPDNISEYTNACGSDILLPPVYGVIIEMLESISFDIDGKGVFILANSDLFGGGLAKALSCRGASCQVMGPDSDFRMVSEKADLFITAIGRPNFVKADMVKDGAVVIDVGIAKDGEKVWGDVDFAEVSKKASYITPVPGGVGPLTIAMTFKNTLELFKRSKLRKS